jgi:PIN domain nuclease of toxin-antitoxin system
VVDYSSERWVVPTCNVYEAKTSFSKLVAQAMVDGMALVTGDGRLSRYPVSVLRAR